MRAPVEEEVAAPPPAPLSVFARLELAMTRHAALEEEDDDERKEEENAPVAAASVEEAEETRASPGRRRRDREAEESDGLASVPRTPTHSVAALAEQLQTLLQVDEAGEADGDEELVPPRRTRAALQTALAKIGSSEKDELLAHLLRQAASSRAQLRDVATLGETIAAQLVRQQHELRVKHRAQLERLERELHDAVHAHPRVAVLEVQVDELEAQVRERDEQLRFAVQKLQRSRQRERELKMLHDPLWVI